MFKHTVELTDAPTSDWAAYDAETDQLIKAAKLSATMKAGLISWWGGTGPSGKVLALPPMGGATLAALESRGLASRNEAMKMWRLTSGNAGNGARFAARLTDLDSAQDAADALANLASARADVEAYDAAQAEHEAAQAAQLPEIAGHSWKEYRERHAYPASPTDALLGWQLIPDGKAVTVGASIMRREGKWLANGYRSGMSSLLSPTWEGTSLSEAGALVVDNIMMRSCGSCDGRGRRIGSWREDCDHMPMPAVATYERAGDAERAYDAENARLEGLSIESEQLAEHLAEVAEMEAQAEQRDQLNFERSICFACSDGPFCGIHASVEAWEAYNAAEIAKDAAARVTTPSTWKTSNGKRKGSKRGWRK